MGRGIWTDGRGRMEWTEARILRLIAYQGSTSVASIRSSGLETEHLPRVHYRRSADVRSMQHDAMEEGRGGIKKTITSTAAKPWGGEDISYETPKAIRIPIGILVRRLLMIFVSPFKLEDDRILLPAQITKNSMGLYTNIKHEGLQTRSTYLVHCNLLQS